MPFHVRLSIAFIFFLHHFFYSNFMPNFKLCYNLYLLFFYSSCDYSLSLPFNISIGIRYFWHAFSCKAFYSLSFLFTSYILIDFFARFQVILEDLSVIPLLFF
jgi:hypothetical protein